MTSIKYILVSFVVSLIIMATVGMLNFLVDPYNFYGNNHFNLAKTQEINQIRLSKAVVTETLKPSSIILGTSRSEFGYDPSHQYFSKPAYNDAVGGASMAEALRYLKHANSQGNLEKVLLVADYIMFNSNEQFKLSDFETYFRSPKLNKYLISLNTLKSSILTFYGTRAKKYTIYNIDGQREHTHNAVNLNRFGGQKKLMLRQADYFKNFNNDNHYRDSGTSSFKDFEEILLYCKREGITLDVIFGPNHVLHWESFDYYIGLSKWYEWKKNIVLIARAVTEQFDGPPIRVVDFTTYNNFTMESIPTAKHENMMFHWELNHYKTGLGDIVLTDLHRNQPRLGKLLTSKNIDSNIEQQINSRKRFVASEKYRNNVLLDRKPGDWNQYLFTQ